MPRQSRGRSAPAARSSPPQSRGTASAAAPAFSSASPARAPAPTAAAAASQAQTKQPGMMAQMAATAGSVAAGSVIGHGISSMLFGRSDSGAAPAADTAAPARQAGLSCEVQAKDFTTCLEKADLNSCSYYLEQLKACQAAAAPY